VIDSSAQFLLYILVDSPKSPKAENLFQIAVKVYPFSEVSCLLIMGKADVLGERKEACAQG
jgi:hypothetical protein